MTPPPLKETLYRVKGYSNKRPPWSKLVDRKISKVHVASLTLFSFPISAKTWVDVTTIYLLLILLP